MFRQLSSLERNENYYISQIDGCSNLRDLQSKLSDASTRLTLNMEDLIDFPQNPDLARKCEKDVINYLKVLAKCEDNNELIRTIIGNLSALGTLCDGVSLCDAACIYDTVHGSNQSSRPLAQRNFFVVGTDSNAVFGPANDEIFESSILMSVVFQESVHVTLKNEETELTSPGLNDSGFIIDRSNSSLSDYLTKIIHDFNGFKEDTTVSSKGRKRNNKTNSVSYSSSMPSSPRRSPVKDSFSDRLPQTDTRHYHYDPHQSGRIYVECVDGRRKFYAIFANRHEYEQYHGIVSK
jgi:hypothetical protein